MAEKKKEMKKEKKGKEMKKEETSSKKNVCEFC